MHTLTTRASHLGCLQRWGGEEIKGRGVMHQQEEVQLSAAMLAIESERENIKVITLI